MKEIREKRKREKKEYVLEITSSVAATLLVLSLASIIYINNIFGTSYDLPLSNRETSAIKETGNVFSADSVIPERFVAIISSDYLRVNEKIRNSFIEDNGTILLSEKSENNGIEGLFNKETNEITIFCGNNKLDFIMNITGINKKSVVIHEIGHYVYKKTGLSNDAKWRECVAEEGAADYIYKEYDFVGSYGKVGENEEVFAEEGFSIFFEFYYKDGDKLKENFPEINNYIENLLGKF